jgi:NAD(P)-dependent dehydrogenase (short-subunit alcohol dehydrogenase family)
MQAVETECRKSWRNSCPKENSVSSLEGRRVLVTGGSRGLGLGIVEALVASKANVIVVARDRDRLDEVARRLGVAVIVGDVTERAVADATLRDVRPDVVVLNAGAVPPMGPIHQLTWEDFTRVWEHDVKAGLHWLQAVIALPLSRGSRVLFGSSGAAIAGSPLSGGYAAAKRMLWLMADYANGVSDQLDLGIRFQALVPHQIIGGTGVGDAAAAAYARRKGVEPGDFLASFGKPMVPRLYGEHIATLLVDPAWERGTAFSFRGETGIVALDG